MMKRGSCFRWALVVAFWAGSGCAAPPQPPLPAVVAAVRPSVPSDPDESSWNTAQEHLARLLLQDLVDPRSLATTTPEVRIRAVTDGERVAFRLEWPDATEDDVPGAARFSDACAVQLPSKTEPDVPAPQMGEPGRPVEITLWRASWQADVDGRKDSIQAIYPNAAVDHYPFEAPSLLGQSDAGREMEARYAPARRLGNRMAGPRDLPVQDLVAQGPGTIEPAAKTVSRGRGRYRGKSWSVVIVRPLPQDLPARGWTQVAFAIWEGSNRESGSVKMRTGWIPFSVEARKP